MTSKGERGYSRQRVCSGSFETIQFLIQKTKEQSEDTQATEKKKIKFWSSRGIVCLGVDILPKILIAYLLPDPRLCEKGKSGFFPEVILARLHGGCCRKVTLIS